MITVVGSFVVDLTSRAPHMPTPGETVLGGPFRMGPGGKGGNQAIAAARQGSEVAMVTKLGADSFADIAKESFGSVNADLSYTKIDKDLSTGVALIIVDESSENMIVVAPGACGKMTKQDVYDAEEAIIKSDVVLTQLETTVDAVIATAELVKKHGKKLIFNPAPYTEFPKEILQGIAYITPNEIEASLLSGVKVEDNDSALHAASVIKNMGVETVIITLGKKGCLLYKGQDDYSFVPAFQIKNVVDTTGAGDAFNGGFAHAVSVGMDVYDAIVYGNAVAGLSVTKNGTAVAMPSNREVLEFIKEN